MTTQYFISENIFLITAIVDFFAIEHNVTVKYSTIAHIKKYFTYFIHNKTVLFIELDSLKDIKEIHSSKNLIICMLQDLILVV